MLAGHYGPAFVMKARFPRVPLWTLFVAVQVVDIFFFVFALLGIETLAVSPEGGQGPEAMELVSIPWTHSLLMTLLYAGILVGAGVAWKRRDMGIALAVALFSHWALDLIVHFHDLPLTPSEATKVGFGVWHWPALSAVLEAFLVGGGYAMLRSKLSGAARRWGDITCGALLLTCVLYYVLPTLPTVLAMALGAEATYVVMTFLAIKVDRANTAT